MHAEAVVETHHDEHHHDTDAIDVFGFWYIS